MSESAPLVAVVVPAYQAASTLPAVVAATRRALPAARLIAVDDGSTDGSGEAARVSCDETVVFPTNRGKGAALRAGIERALAAGADRVVTIDADGQHDPAFAPALVDALGDADLAIGVRGRQGTRMPLGRRATNALSARAMSACAGQTIADAQSGFRAIRRAVLERVVGRGDRYEWETDFLLRAARSGYRVVGVPVSTVYGPASHFRPVRDAMLVIHSIWRHRDGAFGRAALSRAGRLQAR
ncbi:MAG TPA: glycosyltransferase family 2 protein [Gaiellaceae bacterium]|nr:glycosyltransferase family 2 protein [Gaiellaceae bacterium]